MLRQIFAHSLLYFLATYMPMLANFVLLPIINHYLTTDDYAIYGLTFSYIGLIQAFSDLGMLQHFQNDYFRDKENYRLSWGQYMGFLQGWRVIYSLMTAGLLFLLFRNYVGPDKIWNYLLLVTVPLAFFDITKGIGMRHCQFEGNHRYVYKGMLMSGVITLVLTYFLIVHAGMTYMGWFLSSFIARLAEFFYYGYYLQFRARIKASWKFSRRVMWEKVKVVFPLIPKKYSNYLVSNADRAMLDYFRAHQQSVSTGQIGVYNVAYNLANYFGSFQGAVTTVVSPIFFRLFSEKNRDASRMVRDLTFLWFSFSLACAFLACLWIKELVMFLYPDPQFWGAYNIAPLIIMGWCHRPLNVALFDSAIYNEKTTPVMRIVLYAGLTNFVLNLFAIPFLGIEGAMLVSFFTYVVLGFVGFWMPRVRNHSTGDYRPLQWMLLMLCVSVVAYYAPSMPLAWRLGATALVLAGVWAWYSFRGKEIIHSVNAVRMK